MTPRELCEYWKKRIVYYRRKYGKNSIEVKSAKLSLKKVEEGL